MFFIVNKTKDNIIIGDIGLRLGPRQAADLDRRIGREKAERSKQLKKLIQTGIIDVKRKDGITNIKVVQPQIDKDEMKKDILSELKDHVKDGIKEGMAGFKPGLSEGDLSQALEKLALVISQNQGKGQSVEQIQKIIEDEEIPVDIDQEALIRMHARAVDKMADKVKEGFVTYEEKETEGSVLGNVEELEDLLG